MNNSRASHYRHLLLHSPLLILLFGLWIQLSALYDREYQIHNIAMQAAGSSSTTHTAIAENTVINITDKANQTQDTDSISRDTEHASYTMTEINTEVLDIRAGISQDLSKDGFKAVGDLAMAEGWEDGSVEKTLAHAAMGAVVAAVGNGDALGGALGAGAAEAARPATADADEGTQQSVSALVGAIAGGGTGASVGLDGEKYNRQLHQREIELIRNNADKFRAEHPGMTKEEALKLLSAAALAGVDSYFADYQVDPDAQKFINQLAEDNADTFQNNRGQTLFHEENTDLYDQHAVNANNIFGASDLYNSHTYSVAHIANSIANTGQLMDQSKEDQRRFIVNAAHLAATTTNESDSTAATEAAKASLRAAMATGVISFGDAYDPDKPYSETYRRNLVDSALALAAADGALAIKVFTGKANMPTKYTETLGTKGINKGLHERINGKKPKANLPNGYKYNKDGNVITPEGQTLTKGTFTTPSGRTYDHYGREIDMDLKFKVKNHKTGVVKEYTNREWMSKNNNNPYVLDSNGKPVPINRHHNGKKASGPILDIEQPIHQRDTKNLHPYGNNPHPRDPVNRDEWRTDNKDINKQLLEQNKKGEN